MKNAIDDGMKMFRKYQLAIWRSIKNFPSHFTKVTNVSVKYFTCLSLLGDVLKDSVDGEVLTCCSATFLSFCISCKTKLFQIKLVKHSDKT
jgi:hypothetical protein